MHIVALICAGLAALIHVYIFVLESMSWEAPNTRAVFGTTPEQAAQTKQLAYNQGFYNLFLAITAMAGVALASWNVVSTTLLIVALGSMVGAAAVLITNDRTKLRAALVQGLPPLVGLIALLVSSLT